jgi:hypothetical protein
MILISILAILLVVTTISSQSHVKKASASSESCPAGQVKDWAGICFNKSEAKACPTCAPGSAAPAEKPTAAEKPETLARPTGITAEKWAKLSPGAQKGLVELQHGLANRELGEKVRAYTCKTVVEFVNSCIQYGKEMERWHEKYGENIKSPEAEKNRPSFQFVPDVPKKAVELEFKGGEKKIVQPGNFFATVLAHANANKEAEKPTAAEKPEASALVEANKEIEGTKLKQQQGFGNWLAHQLASHAKANKEAEKAKSTAEAEKPKCELNKKEKVKLQGNITILTKQQQQQNMCSGLAELHAGG